MIQAVAEGALRLFKPLQGQGDLCKLRHRIRVEFLSGLRTKSRHRSYELANGETGRHADMGHGLTLDGLLSATTVAASRLYDQRLYQRQATGIVPARQDAVDRSHRTNDC